MEAVDGTQVRRDRKVVSYYSQFGIGCGYFGEVTLYGYTGVDDTFFLDKHYPTKGLNTSLMFVSHN